MAEHTVLVTDHDFADLSIEREELDGVADIDVLTGDIGKRPIDARERLSEADAIINLRYDLDAEAIAAMDDCQVISRYGIGVDNINVEAAADHDIPVTNVPNYCKEEVAIHALTLILALARSIKPYMMDVTAGNWDRSAGTPIHRFSTQTVGVVGYGAIGREVGRRVDALGVNVVASDPFLEPEDLADDPATLVDFETVLTRADFITVHSPLTDATDGMFDADAFDRMRDSAYLVNVARGPIVNGEDLIGALNDGKIAGAGLDVFPNEPPAPDDPLRTHDRVIATPHVGWYSEEANEERRHTVGQIVRDVLTGSDPRNVVVDVS